LRCAEVSFLVTGLLAQCPAMPQLTSDDAVRLGKEIEKGRRFLAQSRTYLYAILTFSIG